MTVKIAVGDDHIELLNSQVKKQIRVAFATAKVRPEHTLASSDEAAGVYVYKARSVPLLVTLLAVSTIAVLQAPSLLALLGWCAFMYVYLDFYGGVLHYVLDHTDNLRLPVVGPACLEFQWHHNIPLDITQQPFAEVAGALNVLVSGKWLIIGGAAAWHWHSHQQLARTWLLVMGLGYFWALLGQWSHRNAHTVDAKRPWWTRMLQQYGVLLDPAYHRSHHAAAFEEPHAADFGRTYPILHGYTGRVLEAMLDLSPLPAVWTGVWAMMTLFDMFVFVGVASAVGLI